MSSTRGGFKYDSRKKRAHFSIYARGGKGKRRRERTLYVDNIGEARKAYAAFCDESSRMFETRRGSPTSRS